MKKNKSNNGFTLIELVIAIAMLAFIMTAVSALMGSSILSFRKTRSNISIQNSAQSIYDKMSDDLMQAKRVVIYGYECSTDLDFDNAKPGDAASGTLNRYYYVSDEAARNELMVKGISASDIKVFSGYGSGSTAQAPVSSSTKIYVEKMIIDISVPIDEISAVETGSPSLVSGTRTDHIYGGSIKLNRIGFKPTGDVMYDVNDTLRATYTFDGKDMYLENRYALQTGKNDAASGALSEKNLYADVFNYLDGSTDNITGCVVTVDYANGAIGLELNIYDNNMRHKTSGMVKLRNSDVLDHD